MIPAAENNCRDKRPFLLENTIQHYAWGTRGERAFIPHLLSLPPVAEQVYAELWMGVHHLAPSRLIDPHHGKTLLSDWIKAAPSQRLGVSESVRFPAGLPYLLKVLSIDQALSIQAHPSQAQAAWLHQQDPDHYPDANHKPELAIAIDYLDALLGFLPPDGLQTLFTATPELAGLLAIDPKTMPGIQTIVERLLTLNRQEPRRVRQCIRDLARRLTASSHPSEQELLFLEQVKHHGPTDSGVLFLLLLNRIQLGPGAAIFIPPGVPHAYLKGNIIECMANSDNVVRLGLTEKFCDAEALLKILNFDHPRNFEVATSSDGYITSYQTPVAEFLVKSLDLMQGESRAFTYRSALSMFLLLDGEISLQWGTGTGVCNCIYRRGSVFVTPANLEQFIIKARSHSKLYFVEIP